MLENIGGAGGGGMLKIGGGGGGLIFGKDAILVGFIYEKMVSSSNMNLFLLILTILSHFHSRQIFYEAHS